jgi:hypothetical protein
MHGHSAGITESASAGLGVYYLLLCGVNWVAAFSAWRKGPVKLCSCGPLAVTNAVAWLVLGTFFLVLALPALLMGKPFPVWDVPLPVVGQLIELPQDTLAGAWLAVKDGVNWASGPVTLALGSLTLLTVFFFGRRFFVRPAVGWTVLNLSLLALGMSMTDPNFKLIVAKPDNVPIVALVFLLGFFTWIATYRAVLNDDRRRQGLGPLEKEDNEKVLVWPDLVYIELICMIVLTAGLLVWGMALQAPLEEPGSTVKTPNPSKAPWYFLGLQEMLVYFDPWYAGVALPSIVLLGLMAIPYMDFNKSASGYYTIEERKFSYIIFQLGFLELWVLLILLGTFLRGPNWNFFGPFEYWDLHKVVAQNNVDLSQFFWGWLGMSMPRAPTGSSALGELPYILLRESPGIVLLLGYFMIMPPLMAATVFRKFFVKMGFIRYMLMAILLLLMATLPLKMVLRWTVNLKYIVSIPEYFLNF